jgi:hypothetical protein
MAAAHTNGKAHRAANRERKAEEREQQRAVSMGYDRGRYKEQLQFERHMPATDTIVVDQGLEDDRKFLSARGWPGATHLEVRLHERADVPQHLTSEVAREIARILNTYRPPHVKPEAHGGTARVLVPVPGRGCAFLWGYNKKFILRSWWPRGSEAGVPQPWPDAAIEEIQQLLEAAAPADLRANPLRGVPSHLAQSGHPGGTRLVLVNDGSFNPVHRGHINVTLAAAQFARDMGYGVSAVYMVPNHRSWLAKKFPSHAEIIPEDDRLQMMRAATAGTEIKVSDWELRKPVYQNSDEYKRHFEALHPGSTFVRVTGEDYGSCAPMPCFEFRDGVWYMRLPRGEGLSSTRIRRAVRARESTEQIAYPHVRAYMDFQPLTMSQARHQARANPAKPVYVGAMLITPADLLRWWSMNIGGLLPQVYAHHMTIKFKPADSDLDALTVGALVGLRIVGFADDSHVQAVAVEPIGVHSASPIPHVTVATDGTPPVKSNELLARGYTPIDGPVIPARIGLFTGKEDVFVRNNPRRRSR